MSANSFLPVVVAWILLLTSLNACRAVRESPVTQVLMPSFSDRACSKLNAVPEVVTSGQCAYASALSSYYQITVIGDNQCEFLIGCSQGDCSEDSCLMVGVSSMGACLVYGTNWTLFVTTWQLQPTKLRVGAYADPSCAQMLNESIALSTASGVCTYSNEFSSYFMVAQTSNFGLSAFSFGCEDSSCTSCAVYNTTLLGECTPVKDGVWALATSYDQGA